LCFHTFVQAQSVADKFTPSGVSGGGRLLSGSINPLNPSQLFIGCDMSGSYRTADKGLTWRLIPSSSPSDSSNPTSAFSAAARTKVQVAGTSGERLYGIRSYGRGTNRTRPAVSSDGGVTWTLIAEPSATTANDQYYSLAADPGSTTAATQRLVTDNWRKLFFSANGGTSWSVIRDLDVTNPTGATSIRLAGAFWNGSTIHVGTNVGVFVSTNGGTSWSLDTTHPGLPAGAQIVGFCGAKHPTTGVTTLFAICVDGTNEVYGWTFDLDIDDSYNNYLGLYTVSLSGSTSWVQRPAPGSQPFVRVDVPAGDSTQPWAVTSRNLYPDANIYKSSNGGANWAATFLTAEGGYTSNQNITTGHQGDPGPLSWFWSFPVVSLDVSDSDPNRVLITGDFPYLTENGGTSWKQLYVNPKYENAAGGGIPRPKSYLHTGLGVTTGHWVHWTAADAMFAACTDIGLQRTTDGGCTWTSDGQPGDGFGGLLWGNWYAIAQQPGTSRLYAAVASVNDFYEVERLGDDWVNPISSIGDVLYSDNQGQAWTSLAGGSLPGPVVALAVDQTQASYIYASVADSSNLANPAGGIYRSTNGGTSWSKLANAPRTEGRPLTIAVVGTNQLVATFCGRTNGTDANGYDIFTDSSGVFYSSNGGSSWSDRSAAGMHYFTRDLVVDPAAPATNWFVAVQSRVTGGDAATPTYDGNGGVYRTTNSGTGWTEIWNKDSVVSVTYVSYVTGATPLLYVTTFDDGLWVSANPNAATPTFAKVTGFPFARARRVFQDPSRTDGTIWVTTQGGGLWRGTAAPSMIATVLKNGANFDFQVDVTETGGTAPALYGITDLATSPGSWSALTGINPAVTNNGTRYTWSSVNLHALFTGFTGGYVRASRTRNDGTVESSDVGGWVTETIPATQTESWGVPWLKAPLYRGPASTADTTTIVLHTGLNGSFAAGKQYYIEIAEGLSAGHRLEINEAASAADVLVVDLASSLNTSATLPDLNGELVRVREHWTLDEVFDKSLFHGTNSSGTADRVLFYTGTAYTTYWLWINTAGSPRWVRVGDASLADAGSRVIPPGEGCFANPKSVAMNGPLPAYGLVRDHAFRQTLPIGTTFVSLGFPITMTPASNHLLVADGFVAANSSSNSDKFLVWTGDDLPLPPTPGWQSYWYWIGGGAYSTRWVKVGDASLADQNSTMLFNRQRAFMVTLKTATPPHTVSRTVPRPWTP